ncbi:MAG: hypothetical protein WBW84_19540 [Acidobacteriaceae bacterium]
MPFHPHIRPCLDSIGYAALVFIPLHEPGLLAASLLHITVCGCGLALLLLLLTYRKEIRELVAAAFCVCADFAFGLTPASHDARRQSANYPAHPAEPFHPALFQRPPPRLA